MRTCLVFLLSMLLSLNAAYAAAVGICDALEQTQSHGLHIGHHSHEHSDDHVLGEPAVDADGASNAPAVGDHHHDHAHPSFSSVLPGIIGVKPLMGCSPLVAAPPSAFVSAPQTLLDHPPRAALA